jgi:hypothetical protein
MSTTTTTLAFVDAVDGGTARLLVGETGLSVPLQLLPPGIAEGSWVELVVRHASAPPNDTADRRHRLADDDDSGDLKL